MSQAAKSVVPRVPDLPPTPGGRIRMWRDHYDWSQGDLAKETEKYGPPINRVTISNIENGKRSEREDKRGLPTFMEAVQIACALDVTFADLGLVSTDYPELVLFLSAEDPRRKVLVTGRKLSGKTGLAAVPGVGHPIGVSRRPLLVGVD